MKDFCLFNPCFVLAGVLAGILGITYQQNRPDLGLTADRVTEVRGWICQAPQVQEDYIYAELSPLTLIQGERPIRYPGHIALYIMSSRETGRHFDPPLAYGDILSFRAILEDPTHYALPGVPDFREMLWAQGILHVVHLKSPLQVEREGRRRTGIIVSPVFDYAQKFESFCRTQLAKEELKLVLSTFLGRKKTLEEVDRHLVKRLGIFHLFVVSGFHVSIVVLVLHWIFRGFGLAGRFLTLVGLWSYVLLAGSTVPALRAGMMVTLFYLLLSAGLSRQFLNALGISALILFVMFPGSLFSSGFQFSYLCLSVIGLFVLPYSPLIQAVSLGFQEAFSGRVAIRRDDSSRLRRRVRFFWEEKCRFWPRKLSCLVLPAGGRLTAYFLGLALCNWFIQFLTLPLNLYYTNRWIWTQWLTNLVLVPFFALFIPLALLLFLTFWLPTGSLLAQVVGFYAQGLNRFMTSMENFSRVSYLSQPQAVEIALYFLLFLSAFWMLPGKAKMAAFLTPLFLWTAIQQPPRHPSGQLTITMLDVGQGESLHLRYPDGTDALIDTGGFFYSALGTSDFVGERLVSRYLWDHRSQGLRYVLLTHPHADHTQGYDFVQKAFPVDRTYFYDLGRQQLGPSLHRLTAGDVFSVADVEHSVLHPSVQRPPGRWNTNERSLVVQLQYKDFKMLFTGDVESAAERHLSPTLESVTVLKVAHHGGRTSTSAQLLRATQPRLAIISAGRGNPFGHPSPATMQRLKEAGIPALATSEWGSLRIVTDGRSWKVFHYSTQEKDFKEIDLEKHGSKGAIKEIGYAVSSAGA